MIENYSAVDAAIKKEISELQSQIYGYNCDNNNYMADTKKACQKLIQLINLYTKLCIEE